MNARNVLCRRFLPRWSTVRTDTTTTANAAIESSSTGDIFSRENISFGNMTFYEFIRAITVLRICSLPGLADNAEQILKVARKCLGERMFSRIMRATLYGQFVAGDTIGEIKMTTQRLRQCNITQMLAVAIEDLGEASSEELLEENTKKVLSCIDISQDTRQPGDDALMQLKLTAMMNYHALLELSLILKEQPLISGKLAHWMQQGCNEDVLRKLLPTLSEERASYLVTGAKRLLRIIEHAKECDVKIVTDAEHTWINPAIQQISIALMRIYNKERPLVLKTYQAYLKETRNLIQDHAKECDTAGVHFGFKLVRGAYLLPETKAAGGSHPLLLCENWNDTNTNYNNCLKDALKFDTRWTRVLLATHNEESVRLAAELLHERQKILGTRSNVAFAQLYGMADYMSYTLGRMGYEVYKALPHGSVEETLPYLCRRAKENTLFLKGIRKEMDMLKLGLKLKRQNKTSIPQPAKKTES